MAAFRQTEERHVSAEVSFMLWSPKMDLIALALVQGEVALHRLSWQRVWLLASPGGKDQKDKVLVLTWRPDGKVLAVGYDSGMVLLCNVENAEIIHTINLQSLVTSLTWTSKVTGKEANQDYLLYTDLSNKYLPKLPSLSEVCSNASTDIVEDSKKLKDQEFLNVLVIGTSKGEVHIFSYGILASGSFSICLGDDNESQKKILSSCLSEDFSLFSLVVEVTHGSNISLYLLSYKIPLLQVKSNELQIIAYKYGKIASLLNYLSSTIKAITEAWEDIVLEIDSKLIKYAQEKHRTSDGTISDDFLELLVFGTPSDALEKFLLHDLTDKGLKKLSQSIEMSYTSIQKLVLKHLQSVAQALYFHFVDLEGMSQWDDKFGSLGLSAEASRKAVNAVGSFLMKATEIQQVIDNSMKNFKAFFRWLYSVILRLSDEPIPTEIAKISQQELSFVGEFLQENFASEWEEGKQSTFTLERVGQYLKDEELSFPPDLSQNPWIKFLESHPEIKNNPLLCQHDLKKSLIQQHKDLESAIAESFEGPGKTLSTCVFRQSELLLCTVSNKVQSKLSHFTTTKGDYLYTAFAPELVSGKDVFLLRESIKTGKQEVLHIVFGEFQNIVLSFDETLASTSESKPKHTILDLQFYTEDVLSLLLLEPAKTAEHNMPVLLQFPLKGLVNEFLPVSLGRSECVTDMNIPVTEGSIFVDKMNFRRLENIKAVSFAVSGARNVVCILFASRRRVRLFEMDVEDEDEDHDCTEQEESLTKEFSDKNLSGDSVRIDESREEDKENSF